MMLAPVVIILGIVAVRHAAHATRRSAQPIPWFVLGFIATMIFNGGVAISVAPKAWIVLGTTFLLSMALAAMSIATDFRKLRAEGLKPLLPAAAAWVFISIFALVLVEHTAYS